MKRVFVILFCLINLSITHAKASLEEETDSSDSKPPIRYLSVKNIIEYFIKKSEKKESAKNPPSYPMLYEEIVPFIEYLQEQRTLRIQLEKENDITKEIEHRNKLESLRKKKPEDSTRFNIVSEIYEHFYQELYVTSKIAYHENKICTENRRLFRDKQNYDIDVYTKRLERLRKTRPYNN